MDAVMELSDWLDCSSADLRRGMDSATLQAAVQKHVAEQLLPLLRRITELEAQVQRLQAASGLDASRSHAADQDILHENFSGSAGKAIKVKTECSSKHLNVPGFVALSDEALSLVLSYLPLTSPVLLQQCSKFQRSDCLSRGPLIWTCISEFLCVEALRGDIASSAVRSLYHWASKRALQVSASDDASESEESQVTYEITLHGSIALGMSQSYLATTYCQNASRQALHAGGSTQAAVDIIRDVLVGAECRLCRRLSTGFRSSEESGGHTNRYEAEFVIPSHSHGTCDQVRLGINVCKYYTDSACGWDEGLDVHCYVDGQELLNLRRDGSDCDYDTQSLNRGLLHQLAAQMLVPASESVVVLTVLWQILCAPLLACSRWEEEKPRFGLALPHRKDNPAIFLTLGAMFAKLADSIGGSGPDAANGLSSHAGDEKIQRFLRFVVER